MTVIRHIGQLVLVPPGPVPGTQMNTLEVLSDAAIRIDGDRIVWAGRDIDLAAEPREAVIDAGGMAVIPGLIDCHTHTVYAGCRAHEFVQRIEGKSYSEIAASGGGIANTVEAVRSASPDELIELALPRLNRMLSGGVTTVEIKSGYGLTPEDELKMLRVIRRLQNLVPQELVATYLAAHTVPREFKETPDAYLDEVLAPAILEQIRSEHLAEFCDVFTEAGAFDVEQSRRVLSAAAGYGMRPRLHADQINQIGATALAGELGAVSADHLETIDEQGLKALKAAGTVGVLLPACSFFLGVDQAPARKILDADIPVALATDYNPGSCMIESLALTLSIACTQMKMTPAECLIGATSNAAVVLGREDRLGAIAPGMAADLVILDVADYQEWLYNAGRDCISAVIKNGKLVLDKR